MTTVKVNLRNNAITQYSGFDFTSFCVFNGRPLGAGDNGIFTLDGGEKDVWTLDSDERRVDAWFELPMSQLGKDFIKQGRRLYIGGEFDGTMEVETHTTCSTLRTNEYKITPRNKDYVQNVVEVPLSYRQRSEYWGFLFKNTKGCDFSIDFVDMVAVKVVRRLGL